ncbi:hypothetical protein CFP56_010725 [Quercus suber]|uniref:Methyltransferase type 11 domain-containing protein n=1 Tax=Quercus suber TaxID=58331 RepID=A0AAW0KZP9_QUESU
MTYDIGDQCPVDDGLVQRLMLNGCEPLPRWRCRPKSPASYETPLDTSIIWDPYTCKSYQCLIERKNALGYFDCKDCFDLKGKETRLDIGGGTATFATKMRERNVTIITSTLNLDGPFNSFIASRGLIPIHVNVSQRLPFFENTLDIVHSMHILSNWIPKAMLEFTLYDIYRALRPGGLFWLDHFFCMRS